MGAACGTIQTDTSTEFFTLQKELGLSPYLDVTPVIERNPDTRQPRKTDHEGKDGGLEKGIKCVSSIIRL